MSEAVVDTDLDLEALFDQVAAEHAAQEAATSVTAAAGAPVAAAEAAPAVDPDDPNAMLFQRLGQVTRMLHEALRELGYDRKLQSAASTMPDARKRLEYVATLTGRSANVVLEGVEHAQSLQTSLETTAAALGGRWKSLYAGALSPDEFKALAGETNAFLGDVQAKAAATRGHLHEMMMAQDFHDLTGQVIKKIVDIAHTVEGSLVDLLLATKAAEEIEAAPASLAGPAVGNEPAGEVVASQEQVDQLLNSLGF
ncbi:MAG: protein phosphatase CheZ [Burkholderiales bacterium]